MVIGQKAFNALLFLFLIMPTVSSASILGVSWAGDTYLIDENTGAGFLWGGTGYAGLNSMAQASDGTLYANSGGDLISIDPVTSTATFVANLSLDIRGLATKSTDVFYAIVNGGSSTVPDLLYSYDKGADVLSFIGTSQFSGIQGLAFAPDGTLYGWDNLATGGLFTIDTATANSTYINPGSGSGFDYQALAFATDGTLFGANLDKLYTIGLDGSSTLVGSGDYSDIRGIAFTSVEFPSAVPVPAALYLFGSGLIGLIGIARKRKA